MYEDTMSKSISRGNRGPLPLDGMLGFRVLLVARLLNCDILLEKETTGIALLLEEF